MRARSPGELLCLAPLTITQLNSEFTSETGIISFLARPVCELQWDDPCIVRLAWRAVMAQRWVVAAETDT